jgi:hypothetical protein
MKKFMFSAVALVAFSFAGMANEVEMDIETIKKVDCHKVAMTVLTIVDPEMNLSQEETMEFYQTVVSNCEKANN